MDKMEKKYGPFILMAGTHSEDSLTGVSLKVKEVGPQGIITEDGQRLEIGRGSYVVLEDREHRCYVRGRKVAAQGLRPGDKVDLAVEVEYDPKSPPFMSHMDLDKRFNTAESSKFLKQGDDGSSARVELEQLKQELEDAKVRLKELESRGKQTDPLDKQPNPPGKAKQQQAAA